MKKHIIFVDCFNTIICRRVSSDDVLLLWAKEINKWYPEVSPKKYYQLFKSCEIKLANLGLQNYLEQEYTVAEIFKEIYKFANHYNIFNYSQTEFISKATDCYNKVEKENQYANTKLIKYLEQQKQNGAKIYIISDFYCDKTVLKDWLSNLKIDHIFDDIFVSCEYKMSKRTGSLYKYVMDILNIKADEILMFGDNLHADIKMAKKLGITAKRVSTRDKRHSNELKKLKEKLFIPTEYLDIFKEYRNEYNYSNHSFPLYIFIKRLADRLIENNVNNIFFFAREGKFFKKLFDYYCEINNINIKSHYFYISRNAILGASLNSLEKEDFKFLIRETKKISIKNFLLSLHFTTEQINRITETLNVDTESLIPNLTKSQNFEELKQNKYFIEYYNDKKVMQRKAFEKYLEQFNVDYKTEGFNFVDVGWKGTSQDFLNRFFDGKININGYYLGCKININNKNTNSKKFGLLYSKNLQSGHYTLENEIYAHRLYDYEQILRADDNQTMGYVIENDKVNVVFEHNEIEKEVFNKIISKLQNQMFEKFKKICKTDKTVICNIDSVCNYLYLNMINKTSKQDIKWLYECNNSHFNNFARYGYTIKTNTLIIKKLEYKLSNLFFYLKYKSKLNKKRKFWQ